MRFVVCDKDYHPINDDGFRLVDTSAGVHIVKGVEPQAPAFFSFECPRGKGMCSYLRIAGGPADDGNHPKWTWNGSRDRPTITPSVNCLSHNPTKLEERYAGCGWHGFIVDGVCKDA